MTLSTLSSNGQTTIPIEIRKWLGLQPSQKILYRIEEGRVVMEAAGASADELYGSLSAVGRKAGTEDEARAAYAKRKYSVNPDA